MSTQDFKIQTLGIVGSGAMGRGIAQIAALGGLNVHIYDTNPKALAAAREYLSETFAKLTAKGKLKEADAHAALARIRDAGNETELSDCDAIVEAIVENLDLKRELFRELEAVVGKHCILASNTSSLSITAIAAGCAHPERVVGFHFFNPVPLMRVVEVIDGLRGDPRAGDALMDLARRMGHTPVRAKDMPGFIVNHAGRGMNTEGLRVASEGIASFADIDRIMREQAGFRLGPFELLDLTALDVSHPVMESIYHQFYEEPRYKPSPITGTRLAGGLIGRKAGEGFYRYVDGKQQAPDEAPAPTQLPTRVWISRASHEGREQVLKLIAKCDCSVHIDAGHTPEPDSLLIVTPLGFDATTTAISEHLDPTRVIAVDTLFPLDTVARRTIMTTPATTPAMRDAANALFAFDGVPVSVIRDSAGFVAQRVVATIVNIACDIAQQGIATPADIDLAVTLGLGYPRGPLALGDALGPAIILTILRNMQDTLGDPRYRPTPWLARRAQLGLSLTHIEELR
ncbi:3-hydroxyacyl-CoA dehydrogenase [Caballeronia hypogeia]|uniref:3-hydroxyacyl-CoA dehydrogenase n=1 Tax=Caballeronia hypogeia TaxID=1777140 RepID=A0A158AXE0_9BURK|nr:3-hydroxyacyl-CoA dehydrogenase [Caballeronia hypogeia]SAK62320.1 3-hydroxyacyl-CoA dehydrogenase [Caballeronia hypogeia]